MIEHDLTLPEKKGGGGKYCCQSVHMWYICLGFRINYSISTIVGAIILLSKLTNDYFVLLCVNLLQECSCVTLCAIGKSSLLNELIMVVNSSSPKTIVNQMEPA